VRSFFSFLAPFIDLFSDLSGSFVPRIQVSGLFEGSFLIFHSNDKYLKLEIKLFTLLLNCFEYQKVAKTKVIN
jgi:hypothetical protein